MLRVLGKSSLVMFCTAAAPYGWLWVVVDVDVGEHANHLLNHGGVRYPSEDRIRDPHDESDYVWVGMATKGPEISLWRVGSSIALV